MIQDHEAINESINDAFSGFPEYAARNEFVPMRELIYQYMREAIINRSIPSGAHLVEDDLARYLSASRTPVREALRKLESEGLVKHHRRRGVEVRQLSLKDVADIYDLTTVLEGYAAKLVAESVAQDTLDKLQRLLNSMKMSIEGSDGVLEKELHQEFHFTIYEACNNKRLENMLRMYNDYIQLFRAYTLRIPGRLQHSWEEHDSILRAIEMRDGELAQQRAYDHLSCSKELFLRQWQAMGEE